MRSPKSLETILPSFTTRQKRAGSPCCVLKKAAPQRGSLPLVPFQLNEPMHYTYLLQSIQDGRW